MDISADGQALYVVNYGSQTLSKVATADLSVIQTIVVGDQPIGVAYDPATRHVWVALYGGALAVFTDQGPKRPSCRCRRAGREPVDERAGHRRRDQRHQHRTDLHGRGDHALIEQR